MKWPQRVLRITGGVLLLGGLANASFAPFEEWKAAVRSGGQFALSRLYRANPPAVTMVGRDTTVALADELRFWAGLKEAGLTRINPKVLQITSSPGRTRLLLRIEAMKGDQPLVGSMVQFWEEQAGTWYITATQRTGLSAGVARRLPQPATPNPNLYPEPGEAQAELKAAERAAARENKRVLVVFGANWCYDCHVLDATFRSNGFAALVQANYVVVHINIGDEGHDNNDLAARLGVALERGVPSLAVLEPNGTVVVAQKNGEFESTVKIGPEEVRAFLEKWKPARK